MSAYPTGDAAIDALPVGGSRVVLTVGGEEFTVQRDPDAGGRRRYAAREMGATLEESDGLERAQVARGKP